MQRFCKLFLSSSISRDKTVYARCVSKAGTSANSRFRNDSHENTNYSQSCGFDGS